MPLGPVVPVCSVGPVHPGPSCNTIVQPGSGWPVSSFSLSTVMDSTRGVGVLVGVFVGVLVGVFVGVLVCVFVGVSVALKWLRNTMNSSPSGRGTCAACLT